MDKSPSSAKELEKAAFACTVALVVCLVGAIIDGFDGVTSMRSHTYRLLDDAGGFRGVLIMRWGYPAILAAVFAFAFGMGSLAAKASEKASTDQ